jgi:hypothetical protein
VALKAGILALHSGPPLCQCGSDDYSCPKITSRKTKRGGRVLWCYHREDFSESWQIIDEKRRSRQRYAEYERQRELEREAWQQRVQEQRRL